MVYYAVALPEPRVFDNWDDCKEYIDAYVKQCKEENKAAGKEGGCLVVHRKFDTLEEAQAHAFRTVKTPEAGDFIAYTDGSYNFQENKCGSGILLFKDGVIQETISFSSPNIFKSNNITSEMDAVIKILEYCVEKGIKRIFIVHDLIHLAEYVREHGFFEADSAATLDYQKRYHDLVDKHGLKVYFNWIKGHGKGDGDASWNNQADKLAGLASGKYKGE